MKKVFLKDMEEEKANELIKKNEKLISMLQNDLHENNLFIQEEDSKLMIGDKDNGVGIKDNYNSFYFILTDWRKFYQNLDSNYLSTKCLTIYKNVEENICKLETIEYGDNEYWELNEKIEENCKILLKDIEDLLHTYEEIPEKDEAIEYAWENEQLNDYYIEVREDGTSDNVIRKDVSYTEVYI